MNGRKILLTMLKMDRGSMWWARFDNATGSEIKKTRPVIIISNSVSNRILNRVQAIPLTSNISRSFPTEVFIQVNDVKGNALAHQITTITKRRLLTPIGNVTSEQMHRIEEAIRLQLGFTVS